MYIKGGLIFQIRLRRPLYRCVRCEATVEFLRVQVRPARKPAQSHLGAFAILTTIRWDCGLDLNESEPSFEDANRQSFGRRFDTILRSKTPAIGAGAEAYPFTEEASERTCVAISDLVGNLLNG